MNSYDVFALQEKIKEIQKPSRYNHTLGVMYTAANMAMLFDVDIKIAMVAGLLHDCAKSVDNDQIVDICDKNGVDLTDFERKNPHLIHGKLGAHFAMTKYGIEDKEILNAIEHHTRGRIGMSKLEQIVFIADFIEPNRKEFPGLDVIRKQAFDDLDKCTVSVLEATFDYLRNSKMEIEDSAIEVYNYYKSLIAGKE